MSEEVASCTVVISDYYSRRQDGTYDRPYRNVKRTIDDCLVDWWRNWCSMVENIGAVDGDEIEITIKRTGRRPFGNRRMVLARPHEYEREPETSQEEQALDAAVGP